MLRRPGPWLQGFLVPTSNPVYWIGLQADGWPTFKWSDSIVPSPSEKEGYTNWGIFSNPANPEQISVPEPNNLRPTEYCAVGNHTQGTGKPFTWAWADTNCFNEYVSICRINRGWLVAEAETTCRHGQRQVGPQHVCMPRHDRGFHV